MNGTSQYHHYPFSSVACMITLQVPESIHCKELCWIPLNYNVYSASILHIYVFLFKRESQSCVRTNRVLSQWFSCAWFYSNAVVDSFNVRGHNWVHFAHRLVYCYHEFKLRYLKNQKLFSIRVKELFKPIVLRKKGDGFLLFLKVFSWETDLSVTLGDFTEKKPAKLGGKICI